MHLPAFSTFLSHSPRKSKSPSLRRESIDDVMLATAFLKKDLRQAGPEFLHQMDQARSELTPFQVKDSKINDDFQALFFHSPCMPAYIVFPRTPEQTFSEKALFVGIDGQKNEWAILSPKYLTDPKVGCRLKHEENMQDLLALEFGIPKARYVRSKGYPKGLLVSPLARGSLAEMVKNPQLVSPQILQGLIQDIVEQLDYLHQNHFSHRDIKPQNMLFYQEGGVLRARLIDFSLSHHDKENAEHGGTFLFSSPDYILREMRTSKDPTFYPGPLALDNDNYSLGMSILNILDGGINPLQRAITKALKEEGDVKQAYELLYPDFLEKAKEAREKDPSDSQLRLRYLACRLIDPDAKKRLPLQAFLQSLKAMQAFDIPRPLRRSESFRC